MGAYNFIKNVILYLKTGDKKYYNYSVLYLICTGSTGYIAFILSTGGTLWV